MIQKLKIKNIQSHKNSELEFSPGINVIIGSSNNGKSAVLRALNWSIYNRPLGINTLLSSWAYDKKAKQIEEMSVEVEKDNSTLIRKKSSSENCYEINGQKLEAIGTNVPEQVENFFSLSETNVQKQMDSPFLLSLGSGKVAEYFNKVVRLDIIDKVLGNVESKRRKTKQNLESSEKEIEKYNSQLENYDWLDKAEKLIKKYEVLENKKSSIQDEIDFLEKSISDFEKLNENVIDSDKLNKGKKLIEKINKLQVLSLTFENDIIVLESDLNTFDELSEKEFDFTKEKKLISKLENQINDNKELQNEVNHLGTSIANFEYYENQIFINQNEIEELKKQLPEVCPLCGNLMKNGVCENER